MPMVSFLRQEKGGAGSLLLDGKKQYAIKHWLELTSSEAHEQVRISLKDGPFQFGPWGEQLSVLKFLFMDSVAGLAPMAASELTPANQEATVTINWSLPLDGATQALLFMRIRKTFERATAIIDQPSDRKKYRMSEEDLQSLRNLMCVWGQIRSFCASRIKNFDDLDKAICSGNSKDHELQAVMDGRPAQFGVSMLPTSQKEALDAIRVQEEGASLEVEKERVAVREARWSFFKGALLRDQEKLKLTHEAPKKLEALKHRKLVAWRVEQSKLGERVIKSFMDKFLRCDLVAKPSLAQQKINEFRSYVVSGSNLAHNFFKCRLPLFDFNCSRPS